MAACRGGAFAELCAAGITGAIAVFVAVAGCGKRCAANRTDGVCRAGGLLLTLRVVASGRLFRRILIDEHKVCQLH